MPIYYFKIAKTNICKLFKKVSFAMKVCLLGLYRGSEQESAIKALWQTKLHCIPVKKVEQPVSCHDQRAKDAFSSGKAGVNAPARCKSLGTNEALRLNHNCSLSDAGPITGLCKVLQSRKQYTFRKLQSSAQYLYKGQSAKQNGG